MSIASDMPSSSLSFASSSHLSSGSCTTSRDNITVTMTDPESLSLGKLSASLETLLVNDEDKYTDAEIVVEDIRVGVHRCILSARSPFFYELFKKQNGNSTNGEKPKYLMCDLVPYTVVGYEAFCAFLHYLYTGKLKPAPPEVSTCVDDDCLHESCRPAIDYAVELLYASATFQMKELVLLVQRHLLNFVDKALVEDVVPILLAAFHCQLDHLLALCIERVARSDLDNVCIDKELPAEVSSKINLLRGNCQHETEAESIVEEVDPVLGKNAKNILKALDSDDVELVKLLLQESDVSLNDIFALHYTVAYCDVKVVKEVLGLGLANPNLKNSRGHTVLHVAARRKQPSVLMALLTNGACVSETTPDGKSAKVICRRMTRPKDFNENKQCRGTNNDRLCITILERERRNSLFTNISVSSQVVFDDQRRWLEYLEDRVLFARYLFPDEARLAMEVADSYITSLYRGLSTPKLQGSNGNLKEVDLNETPSMETKRIQMRLEALVKTVEMGRYYFPHCSEVIDNFLEDDMPDSFFLEKGTPEEQSMKKKRFLELRDDVQKAFYKDIAESSWSALSSSSSPRCSSKKIAGSKRKK